MIGSCPNSSFFISKVKSGEENLNSSVIKPWDHVSGSTCKNPEALACGGMILEGSGGRRGLRVCARWVVCVREREWRLGAAGLYSKPPPPPAASVQGNREGGRDSQPWPFSSPATEWLHATLCQQSQWGHGSAARLSGAQVRGLNWNSWPSWPCFQDGKQEWVQGAGRGWQMVADIG